ncbi:hypothetical protein PRK78_003058 [Emydomyces testavorans]|uniref:Aminoglycoside phosphotransferase domain-containing protein n=1 Tax=Emydomyces testavorans TaxID=2070801 RepID=A0AAF0DHH0_9EURO|nr:hypothetical protein PRK78_003058 [Emydomyces testavorans]
MTEEHTSFNISQPFRLTPSMLPNDPNADFRDSSFFQRFSQLPTPSEVRAEAKAQHLAGTSPDKRYGLVGPKFVKPPPVLFESLGLFVKWGYTVTIAEGQCLYALSRFLKGAVPVPEVYGWRTENEHVYIYMEALTGRTLEEAWDMLGVDDRDDICQELKTSFDNLRRLEQCPNDRFIGSINRMKFYDRAINVAYMHEAGPFPSVKHFHDWFSFLCRRRMPDPYCVNFDWLRVQLPDDDGDDAAIKFTHGDLHRSNVIVSTTPPRPRVVGIVDWEQSGWFPEYWEERKAIYTALASDEWITTYLPKILKSYKGTEEAWGFFTDAIF